MTVTVRSRIPGRPKQRGHKMANAVGDPKDLADLGA